MQVQRVIMPASGTESWTVLGDDDVPVVPVERYLAYLTDVERSPNTVRAYAHDLKDYCLPGPGLAAGAAGGHRRLRDLAAPAPGGPGWRSGCAAIRPRAGDSLDSQPEAVGSGGVLPAPGPPRSGGG